ncbi:GNAT family N-acetyltransferase [Allocoleopsis sp.]|uniref:GNAT family N-acetyltransferase n=1 Tax=Allocoleopsis sp. TaxID=3088169 RepID=UPI002FD66213
MVTIQIYLPNYQEQIINLILDIQQNEFNVPIRLEEQPGLLKIHDFYQNRRGNFWIALDYDTVVGTVALLDIGNHQATLQKFFVCKNYRGKHIGVGQQLLDTLLAWAMHQSIKEIYLGTTEVYRAAHRFYEKNGFIEIKSVELPNNFPLLKVDTKFYKYVLY